LTGLRADGSEAAGYAKGNGSLISTEQDAHGSHAWGSAEEGVISTGEDAYGSHAWGNALNEGQIKTGENAKGSEASGFASGPESLISTGDGAEGSRAEGYVENGGQILTGLRADGSEASGYASSGGSIKTGDDAEASHAWGFAFGNGSRIETGIDAVGSLACGYAQDGGNIFTGNDADGSEASGYAIGENSSIQTGGQSKGSHAWGSAETNSFIKTEDQSKGSHAWGSAETNSFIKTEGQSKGSHAWGSAETNSFIITGPRAFGSEASGYVNQNSSIGTAGSAYGSKASGVASAQSHIGTYLQAYGSMAWGYATNQSDIYTGTSAYGSEASGYANKGTIRTGSNAYGSRAIGWVDTQSGAPTESIEADGLASFAFGRHVKNSNNYSLILGRYGIAKPNSSSSSPTISGEGSFQIAGGQDSNVSNGISVIIGTSMFNNVAPTGGGAANFWLTSGADYAEYFEWLDGNPDNEDRIGYFVELEQGKIKLASSSNRAIGVVTSIFSGSSIIADVAYQYWHGAHLRDEFGRVKYRLSYASTLKDILTKYNIEITDNIRQILQNDNPDTIKDELLQQEFRLRPDITSPSPNLSTLKHEHSRHVKTQLSSVKELTRREHPHIDSSSENPPLSESPSSDSDLTYPESGEPPVEITTNSSLDNPSLDDMRQEILNAIPIRIALLNPEFDPSRPYVPRSDRKEWAPVGLLGKVFVRDNGLCQVGDRCNCENGIAIPGQKWPVLSRHSPQVIRILFLPHLSE
jgi:oligoribonuclease (3'-5' exoribonuclease)